MKSDIGVTIQMKSIIDNQKIKKVLPWIVLVLLCFADVLFLYKYVDSYVDSDMAVEMIYAKMLNDRHSLITSDFFSSTGPRIIGCWDFFKIGLYIFPHNWRLARVLGSAIILALLVMCNICVSRKFSDKNVAILFTTLVVTPFGMWYMFHVLFGYLYTTTLIIILLFLNLYIRYKDSGKKYNLLLIAVLMLLSGMMGIRMAQCILLPLLGTVILEILYTRWHIKSGDEIRKNIKPHFIGLFISIVGFAIGYLYYAKVISVKYTFERYDMRTYNVLDISSIVKNISDYFAMFGYPYDDFLLFVQGGIPMASKYIVLVGVGLLAAVIVLFMVIFTICKVKELSTNERFILEFYLSSFAVLAIVTALVHLSDYSYYWITVIPQTFMVMQIAWNHSEFKLVKRQEVFLCTAVMMVLLSVFTCIRFVETPVRARPELKTVTNVLEILGADKIYAAFWDGPVITEMSNGNIESYTVNYITDMEMSQWLQDKSHLIRPTDGDIYIVLYKDGVPERDVNNLYWYDPNSMEFVYGDGNTSYWILKTTCDKLRL